MVELSGYYDCNATRPLCEEALAAWMAAQKEGWCNSAGLHSGAAAAARRLAQARQRSAVLLGVAAEQIIFCGGATEALNGVIREWGAGRRVAVSAIEHSAVRLAAERWASGCRALPVDAAGVVDMRALEDCLVEWRPELVAVMAVNNETGVEQDWVGIGQLCQRYGVAYLCDAVQLIGKGRLDGLGGNAATVFSAHKFGGPKGVGLCVLGGGYQCVLQLGGGHEGGRRAGTVDVPGIAALVAALEVTVGGGAVSAAGRDAFEARLSAYFGTAVRVHGAAARRVGSVSFLQLPRFSAQRWIQRLDRLGFAVGSGAACSTGKRAGSVVLRAMGVEEAAAVRSVRFSGGPWHTVADWLALADAVATAYQQLQADAAQTEADSMVIEI